MEYIRTITREFDVGARADLSVDGRSGAIAVRGEETQQVRVEVVARLWAESDAEADDQMELISRSIRQDGEKVSVRAPNLLRPPGLLAIFGRGPRIDYQLTAPRTSRALVASRSGRLEVANVAGPIEVQSSSGQVVVEDVGADTTITSRSGRVQAKAIGGSLVLECRSGKVQVRGCEGDVGVQSRSGTIQIEEVRGSLRVESRSGTLNVSNVGGSLAVRSRSGTVRYEGGVHGPFDIEVTSGAVLLAVDRDSNFFLDAEATSGAVRSDLPLRRGTGGASSGRPAGPTVRIRTRSGSIHILPR